MEYLTWLDAGLQRLDRDYFDGKFNPLKESDIKCHLYHTLTQTKLEISIKFKLGHRAISELSVPKSKNKREFIDLALGYFKTKTEKDKFEPSLLIEIKKTSKKHLTGYRAKSLEKDVEKLRSHREWLKDEKPVIFKNLRKPVVYLFFMNTNRHGITMRADKELKEMQKDYPDIIFRWGPIYRKTRVK